jgi:hypothetical protein
MKHACALTAAVDRRSPLSIALERRARIAEVLSRSSGQGFDARRIHADLRAVEREIQRLKAESEQLD